MPSGDTHASPGARSPPPISSKRDTHRTVIATHHLGVDLCTLHGFAKGFGDHHIVDSPPDISLACAGELAPPRVVPVALLEQPEGVDEACIQDVLKTPPLLVGETLL